MNWIAPFRYTFEALSINEMNGEDFCLDGLSRVNYFTFSVNY